MSSEEKPKRALIGGGKQSIIPYVVANSLIDYQSVKETNDLMKIISSAFNPYIEQKECHNVRKHAITCAKNRKNRKRRNRKR